MAMDLIFGLLFATAAVEGFPVAVALGGTKALLRPLLLTFIH